MQLDLFAEAAARVSTQYVGWLPDKASAEAYQAEWELLTRGVTSKAVSAPRFPSEWVAKWARFYRG